MAGATQGAIDGVTFIIQLHGQGATATDNLIQAVNNSSPLQIGNSAVQITASLIPGPAGIVANGIALAMTGVGIVENRQTTLGDIIGMTGSVAGMLAPIAVALGIPLLGATLTVAAAGLAVGGLVYTINDIIEKNKNKAISDTVGTTPDPLVKTIHYVDPLILDLDGDGLEITPLSQTPPVLFDADGDTVRTGTAWAAPDDGLLVLDRNGNGNIDAGAELFGDETLLANGQKASHGFAALSELDSNHDGQFNASDTKFSAVRIWRDVDQDGVSDAGELKTLVDSGVQSIKIASTTTNTNYGDAVLVQDGTFTRVGGATGQVGSFILAQNSFVREFAPITVSDAAKALPNFGGSGWVRDLQEAATQSPELIGIVGQAANASMRAGYQTAVASLLREWGNDSAYDSASKKALASGYGLIYSEPQDAQERGWMDKAVKASEADRNVFRGTLNQTDLAKFDAMRERMVGTLEKVYAYEAFTGYTFLNWGQISSDATNYVPRNTTSGSVPVVVEVPLSQILFENRNAVMSSQSGYIRVTIPAPPTGEPHIDTLWSRLVTDATTNMMPALRLSKYLDMVDLNITEAGVSFDFARLNSSITSGIAANAYEGSALFLDIYKAYGTELDGMGWNGTDQLRGLMQTGLSSADVRNAFSITGYSFMAAGTTAGTAANDVFAGDAAANTFNGSGGNDLLDGQAGADSLTGGQGDDVIFGGDGNDSLVGDDGNDTLDGGKGNDILSGGLGNNTFLFGKGDGQDLIASTYDATAGKLNTLQLKSGVATSEVIIKQAYDNYFGGNGALEVSIAGTTDKLTINGFFYGDDPASAYNSVQQIKFTDGGTVWDIATIKSKLFAGTAGNDTVRGTTAGETLNGLAGDDNLNGAAGNDTVNGGDGNDVLSGEGGVDSLLGGAGNDSLDGGTEADTLDGGTGNDTLYGGTGNNTYLFGKGDGQDLIGVNYDATAGKLNTLQLKSGVATSEVIIKQAYDNYFGGNGALEVSIAGTTDKLTINGFFYGDDPASAYNSVQQIKFTDGGTVWDIATIKSKLFAGTAGNDTVRGTTAGETLNGLAGDDNLNGAAGNDTVNGGDGNDVLSGEGGVDSLLGGAGNDSLDGGTEADTLDGGTGNDTLYGGTGNNTYLFGKGDGQDLIGVNYDATAGKLNTLQLKSGVATSEVIIKQAYDNYFGGNGALEVSIAGTTDKLTINGFFYGDDPASAYNSVQQIKFTDGGTVWDIATIKSKLFAGTAGNDTVRGTTAGETLNGLAGDDNLNGAAGNDTVNGGDGNDVLSGEGGVDSLLGGAGNDSLDGGTEADTLDGGTGNDTLYGGTGNNTYLFGKGDGQDLIGVNYDATAGKLNTLQLKSGVATSEVIIKQAYDNYFGGNGALEVSIAGTTDKLTINGFFYGDDPASAYNSVQQIKFTDGGTVWDIATIKSKLFAGTAGNDTVRGTTAGETLNGLAGDDNLNGAAGNDTVNGGDGNDVLSGEGGVDSLLGGAGNDSLDGGTEADTLDGGTGNDTLYGGTGNNTYLFGKGDGQDLIGVNYDATAGKLNTLQLKSGVATSEVIIKQAYDNYFGGNGALEVSIAGTTDKLTINGFFYGDDPASAYNSVQQIKFTDGGTVWDIATIKSKLFAGTAGNDTVRGTTAGETLNGLAGDDNLNGAAGNDTVNGGDGNDVLSGEGGVDSLLGGAGNDSLDGGTEADTLDGGTGNDTLYGGTGNNTYLFGKGDGQDLIGVNYDATAGKLNTLQLKSGVATSEVIIKQAYDNYFGGNGALEVSIAGTTDKLTINGFFYGDDPASAYNSVQQIKFTDGGTVWDIATIKSKLFAGTAGNDTVRGTTAGETLNGLAGDDNLNGAAGNDTVNGGDGNDVLSGEGGVDSLLGGAGNDSLDGGTEADTLDGGTGNDTLYGGTGNNTYLFGKGDGQDLIGVNYDATAGKLNTLQLKSGVATSEVIIKQAYDNYFGGNGALEVSIAGTTDKLTINGFFYGDDPASAYNSVQQIKFTDGGTVWDIATIKSKLFAGTAGNDTVRGTTAGETLNGLAGDDNLNGAAGNDTVNGGDGNDVLSGEGGVDSLLGGAGNDSLDGGTEADTLDGGTGNDTLYGGTGNNTYLFGKGDGQDLIGVNYDATAGKLNTLQLKSGVATSEVIIKQAYDNYFGGNGALEVSIAGTTDKLTINGFFYGDDPASAYNSVQQIKFTDGGTVWDIATIKSKLFAGTAGNDTVRGTTAGETLNGLAGDDNLNGAAGNDTVNGGDGNDVLSGEGGVDSLLGGAGNDSLDGGTEADTLDGGTGNDTLYGGTGNNTFLFGKGDGQDLIASTYDVTAGKLNTLLFKSGVSPSEITIKQVADNYFGGNIALEVSIAGTADKVTISGFFLSDDPASGHNPVQQIKFTDSGTVWDIVAIQAMLATNLVTGTANAETLTGTANGDKLTGLAGDDTLNAGAGNDVLDGGAGNDTMAGSTGNDYYIVDAATDTVTELAGEGNDTVSSLVTLPTLANNVENLILAGTAAINGTGNALANRLYGNSAANGLNGGAGADVMAGAAGNDTYTVDDVNDIIVEFANEGTDLVSASVSSTLSANVENLTLTGSNAINGTGNELANVLTGNSAANTLTGGAGDDSLNGGAGADALVGGAGNDAYTVDNAADVVTEGMDEGIDSVSSSVTYTLGGNVENLTLTGNGAINGTGNALANTLNGNGGTNVLSGGEGDDLYIGGGGNDSAVDSSTTSNDVYRWGLAAGSDTISDAGGADRIELGAGITAAKVTLTRNGNDLVLGLTTSAETLKVLSWYVGTENRIEEIRLANGDVIPANSIPALQAPGTTSQKVGTTARNHRIGGARHTMNYVRTAADINPNLLLDAMAQFSPPSAASTLLTADRHGHQFASIAVNAR